MPDFTPAVKVIGPISDPAELKAMELPMGTPCVDDAGVVRQRVRSRPDFYGDWTQQGNGPLTHAELLSGHVVWIIKVENANA